MNGTIASEVPVPKPLKVMAILLTAIFCLEMLLMVFLPHLLPTHNRSLQNGADALLLTLFCFPFLYRFIFKPFQNSVQMQQALTDEVLAHLVDGVIIFDDQGKVHFLNDAAQAIFGYQAQEMAGKDLHSLLMPGDQAHLGRVLAEAAACRTQPSWECTGMHKDGSPLPLEFSVSRIRYGDVQLRIGVVRDTSARKKAEAETKKALSLLSATLESTADGILVRDLEGNIIISNRRLAEMWRLPQSALETNDQRVIRSHIVEQLKAPEDFLTLTAKQYAEPELESKDLLALQDGRVFERVSMPHIVEQRIVGRVICFRDVTEQKKLELQLRHAQKMEALGTLASGVAHDFNNILTIIIGYCSMALSQFASNLPLVHIVNQILAASEKAASLTGNLLAYGRKNPINPQPFDLNETLRRFDTFLSRIIGEEIELITRYSDQPLTVQGDSGQIEQVLMNLATNARDAMSGKGCLIITTRRIVMDREFVKLHGFGTAGSYAHISISDTGIGMDEETREKIFEPFFTTKGAGSGTGLGLSIAYGIIKQHAGQINVYSEPGKGTTFNIYLPIADSGQALQRPEPREPSRGKETLLLAEDDANVRELVRSALLDAGYQVIEAANGEDAVALFREHQEKVDLLLMDVIMPRKNGKEAFAEISRIKAGVKAIFMSGYTADIIQRNGLVGSEVLLLEKPLSPRQLLDQVRKTLDAR